LLAQHRPIIVIITIIIIIIIVGQQCETTVEKETD